MSIDSTIPISIAFCDAHQQGCWIHCRVPAGASIRKVLSLPNIQKKLPPFEWETITVGIWGKSCGLQTTLKADDRLEIYAPLQADPKALRQQRAKENPKERDKWRRKK